MQRSALRSIYGGSQPKVKQAAVVAPVLDQSDECNEENSSPSEEEDDLKQAAQMRYSNNWSTTGNVNRVPEDQDDEGFGVVLQKKSAQYEIPRLVAFSTNGPFSNQEHELYQQQPGVLPSGSAQKYTVLGQKQKWRKSRAQRSRRLGQTISPVDDATDADEYVDDENDLENPSPRQSSSSYISVDERLDSHRSYGSQGPPPPPPLSTGRGTSREDSETSSRYDSDLSTGRSASSFSSSTGEEKQRFVVTRQKKSKYAARIHLPGQQNPLYLGRYRNEEAALAACESAYSVITTPRK